MKAHYLENQMAVCGTTKAMWNVSTREEWYNIDNKNKCEKCAKQISIRTGTSHVFDKLLGRIKSA